MTPNKNVNSLQGDRFIPSRNNADSDMSNYRLLKENNSMSPSNASSLISPSKEQYRSIVKDTLLGEQTNKILAFKGKAPASNQSHDSAAYKLYTSNSGERIKKKQFRQIPEAPERILDAPEIVDDYYLNLMDWGSNNMIAVALNSTVYLWNATSGSVDQLCQCPEDDDYITSVSWASDGKHLAVGTSTNHVQIWDVDQQKQLRQLRGHSARVSSLAWNGATLTSGGRDSLIINHDVRQRQHIVNELKVHQQEVCGLKWSPSGQQLASGGNDNLLHIFDRESISRQTYLHRMTDHKAAVKALAWCPFQSNLLATGGGTADRCIKFWNSHTGACVNSIDTGSQVCSLVWSKHEKEILSSHGYSQNQLCLWKYPTMTKMAELNGHTARVLHMAQSPDGTSVVSAAADETLRFWRCFGDAASKKADGVGMAEMPSFLSNMRSIR